MLVNPDKLTHFSASSLRVPAFAVLNAMQSEPAETQILALATALSALCDGLQVDAHDALIRIDRAKRHIDGPFSGQYKAIAAYAQGELR